MALSGNEVLFVQGVASNGQLSGQTRQTTTAAIAALASSDIFTSVTISGSSSGTTSLVAQSVAQGSVALPAFATGTETLGAGASAYGSSALNSVSTTTLAYVPGLAVPVTTSGTYIILAQLPVNTSASAGFSVAVAASNSLTATSLNVTSKLISAAAIAAVNTTTLGGNMSATAAIILAELTGTIVVNTGGTLIIQAAQSVSSAATTTVNAGGSLQVRRVS